jgi:hypothetical protein
MSAGASRITERENEKLHEFGGEGARKPAAAAMTSSRVLASSELK